LGGPSHGPVDIADLAASGPLEIAVDTEFFQAQTLTVQVACIHDKTLRVKVYRAQSIPRRPRDFKLRRYLPREKYSRFFRRSISRREGLISRDLSPAVFIKDLFRFSQLRASSRTEAEQCLEHPDKAAGPVNGQWDEAKQRWRVPMVRVVLVGHFLRADFGRMFGREFLAELIDSGELAIRNGKRLGFADPRQPYNPAPVVQYAAMPDGSMFAIALEMRDTFLPYGSASLEEHSTTFLRGVGKLQCISEDDNAFSALLVFDFSEYRGPPG
jgi:hypothetical protein